MIDEGLRLTLANRLDALEPARQAMAAAGRVETRRQAEAALVARVAAAGLPTRLRLDADLDGSCAGVELAAYRVVQEALTNCLKHASADNAEVVVGLDRHGSGSAAGVALQLEVWDDGSGAGADAGTCGHGISGMHERVSVYGGTLSAGPGSDGGYRVSARIPLVAECRAGVA